MLHAAILISDRNQDQYRVDYKSINQFELLLGLPRLCGTQRLKPPSIIGALAAHFLSIVGHEKLDRLRQAVERWHRHA